MFKFLSYFLLTAASQAKKEALAKKYSLSPEMLDTLDETDPTHGEYVEWLAREYSRNGEPVLEGIQEKLTEFIKIKRNPEWPGDKNILNYPYAKFIEVMEAASREDYSKKQRVRDIEENAKKYIEEGVLYLGKAGECYCYQPTTPMAASAMAQGTHWCTKGEGTAASYLRDGKIYIFTKFGYENHYGNDKYAQIFVSSRKLEAETAEGKDIVSNNNQGAVFTEECFSFLKFLAPFNETVKESLESERYHLVESDGLVCFSCSEPIEEDDAYTGGDETYCETCYYEHYTSCDYCGSEIDTENDTYVSNDYGTYCEDCGSYCSGCDSGYCVKGRNAMSFYEVKGVRGRELSLCSECFSNDFFSCNSCEENFNNDERYEFDSDDVCGTCFKEKWSESTVDTLNTWVESEGLEDIIVEDVLEEAVKLFDRNKDNLAGGEFKKMQEAGYLYSWDDLDLSTAIQFIPDHVKNQPGTVWKELSDAIADPLNFALHVLAEEIERNENPSEEWGEEELVDWLGKNDIIDENEQYVKGQTYFATPA